MKKSILVLTAMVAMVFFGCKESPYINQPGDNSFNTDTIPEIAEDNDVSIKQIEQWVREERLAFAENSPLGIACERCGEMIKSGRYCDKCRGKITNTLRSALDTPPKKNDFEKKTISDRDRMRFLDSPTGKK